MKTNFKFDPAWLLQVIEETAAIDTYFKFDTGWLFQEIEETVSIDIYHQSQLENITFLREKIPNCKLLDIEKNGDFENNIYLLFVDSKNPNLLGSKWQFKMNIKIEAVGADLIFDILADDRIGGVEIWFHPESNKLSKLYWLLKQ